MLMSTKHDSRYWLLPLLIMLASSCSRNGADSQSSPEALRVLNAASDFYRKQPGIRVETRLEAEILNPSGDRFESIPSKIESRTIVVQPSNRYVVGGNEFRLASDGTSLRVNRMLPPAAAPDADSDKDAGEPARATESDFYFRIDPAPETSALVDLPMAQLFGGAENLRIAGLLEPGLSESFVADGATVTDQGLETINGTSAHHLLIQKRPVQGVESPLASITEMWIAADGDPVLLQVKHLAGPQFLNFGRQQITAYISSTETFGEWQFDTDVPDETFAAVSGSRRTAGLGQLLRPASPLLGQSAPPVELSLADGSTTSTTALKEEGKIVLLDFWATWCGPCLAELPFVIALAEEFADDGVVLIAVNQGEAPHQVKTFQLDNAFQFTTAFDEAGEISNAFQVDSIPHLCIIGRDGSVQVVHVGVGRDTESAIRAEVEALVSGRNIAADGLPD